MNEEMMMQHSVEQQLQPPKKEHKALKRILIVIVSLALIGGIGYGVAWSWKQYTDVKDSLASARADNESLQQKNAQLQGELDALSEEAPTITATLPNGKTATYADTPENRNILWWSAGAAGDNYIVVSHRAYREYMATADAALVTKLCGSDSAPKAVKADIHYGTLDTTSKTKTLPQTANCVATIASATNTDAASKAAAQKVLDQIKTEVDAFIASVTIK